LGIRLTTEKATKYIVERSASARLRLGLRHATTEQSSQQAAEHVIHAGAPTGCGLWRRLCCASTTKEIAEQPAQGVISTLRRAASFRAVGLTRPLDRYHPGASLPPLQHLVEGLPLIGRQVLHRLYGRSLQNFGRNLALQLL